MKRPKLTLRFAMHLRGQHGSTYHDDILNEAGEVIGRRAEWVPKARARQANPPRTVFTLDGVDYTSAQQFSDAYVLKLAKNQSPEA